MSHINRYPTWALLLVAIATVAAVVVAGMILDQRANPRRLWLTMLAAWLALIGLARAGVFRTWAGQELTPNEGPLVPADLWAGLLVVMFAAGRASLRLPDHDLQRLRRGSALVTLLGRRRARGGPRVAR